MRLGALVDVTTYSPHVNRKTFVTCQCSLNTAQLVCHSSWWFGYVVSGKEQNAHPCDCHHFLFFLCQDINNIPYTAVAINGDSKSVTEHTLTLTDVRTKPVISISGE